MISKNFFRLGGRPDGGLGFGFPTYLWKALFVLSAIANFPWEIIKEPLPFLFVRNKKMNFQNFYGMKRKIKGTTYQQEPLGN